MNHPPSLTTGVGNDSDMIKYNSNRLNRWPMKGVVR
jgi:hypothetical protein